nr:MAG TPA: hypothetical protein [Caudoviricetes sp.]
MLLCMHVFAYALHISPHTSSHIPTQFSVDPPISPPQLSQ